MQMNPITLSGIRGDMMRMDLPLQTESINKDQASEALKFNPVKEMFNQMNTVQNTAENSSLNFSVGDVDNIHRVAIDMQEATLSLKLAVQVRNKALESYQEIMRMQI